MKTNTVIFFIGLFALGGCKPQPTPQKQVNNVDASARNLFCAYGFGSYWTYQNQYKYDSTFMIELDSSYAPTGTYENFSIQVGSILPDQEVDLYITHVPQSQKTHAFINYNVPYGVIYELDFTNNSLDSNGLSPYSYADTLYNYRVNQYTFPQALKIYAKVGDSTRYVIYVPEVGIIEKRLDTNTVPYKLTNYHIVN